MKQNELLKWGMDLLNKENIEDAKIKAKRLLEFILNQSREEFIRNSLEDVPNDKENEFQEKLAKLIEGKPLQYITNAQEFMGLNFYVDENVLIPQPDTEILVEQAIENIKIIENKKIQILDLCTGSGAIAVSLAKRLASVNNLEYIITATDISNKALEVASKNAIQNQVKEKIQFIQSDLFENIQKNNYDIIISNPPYIETNVIETLSKEVKNEPLIALDGGKDGLEFYKAILKNAVYYLKKGGYVLLEIGYDQGKKIIKLWQDLKQKDNYELELVTKNPIKDLGGNDRVLIFKHK